MKSSTSRENRGKDLPFLPGFEIDGESPDELEDKPYLSNSVCRCRYCRGGVDQIDMQEELERFGIHTHGLAVIGC
jgi:hypothetical protein